MNIEYKTKGNYLSWSLNDDILTLGQTLQLSLSALRCGNEVTIDVFSDCSGNPTLTAGDWYLAQIVIPGQTYTIRETGEADAMGFRQLEKIADKLDLDSVSLILWAKEG